MLQNQGGGEMTTKGATVNSVLKTPSSQAMILVTSKAEVLASPRWFLWRFADEAPVFKNLTTEPSREPAS